MRQDSGPLKASGDGRVDGRTRNVWSWSTVLIALGLMVAAYANAVPGEFVYDDEIQIVRNDFLKDPGLYGRALTSDVWAFKGARDEAWSNYYRPTFVGWLILNYRMFGLSPAGWHVTNILLHAVVTLLAYRLLLRLGVSAGATAVVVWLFAVHPVHVESVTWISGSTDLLFGAGLLGSLLGFLKWRDGDGGMWLAVSLLGYVFALGAKEVSVLFGGIVFAVALAGAEGGWWRRIVRAVWRGVPYLVLAVLFLFVRAGVLKTVSKDSPWAVSIPSMLMTVPQLLVFYLRQILVPLWYGPNYSVRAVDPASPGLFDFFVPVLVLLACAVVVVAIARKWGLSRWLAAGVTLFVFPLAPAMYIRAFLPDQLVHDRYAYLPSLGVLLIVVAVVARLLRRPKALMVGGLVASLLLLIPTIDYNRAWHNDFNLWRRAAATDPTSATNLATFGLELRRAGKTEEAKVYLNRALDVFEGHTTAQYNLAVIAMQEGNDVEAERRLRFLVDGLPEPFEDAINQLGKLYEKQGRFDEVITLFEKARAELPFRRAKYTVYIAVGRFRAGQPAAAMAELESIVPLLEKETDPTVLEGWFFLADLYRHAGRMDEAKRAAQKYLEATKDMSAEQARLRSSAEAIVNNSGG